MNSDYHRDGIIQSRYIYVHVYVFILKIKFKCLTFVELYTCMCMHIKTYINSLLRKINIGKSFRWYLKRYDMALWDWYFFHCESHSEILSVNPNKTFILDQSHTRVCGILLFFVRDGACLCKSNRKSENIYKRPQNAWTWFYST